MHQPSAAPVACGVQVELASAEFVTGCLELDERLKVVKPDPAVSQMMGVTSVSEMRGKPLNK